MANLQKNKIFILSLILTLSGCVTSKYHAGKPNVLGTDIEASPDRIIAKCEFIADYEGDYPNPHGFMIHILDNEKTVLTVSAGTVLQKKDCFELLKTTEKIIKDGQTIFVRGRGDAERPIELEEFVYYFPKHGTFRDNGRSLNFLGIWNDKGQCYSAFPGRDDFCLQGRN